VALEHLPIRDLSDAEIKSRQKKTVPGEDEEHEREFNKALKVGNKYVVPEIRSAQMTFLCLGDHTVLSVRRRSNLKAIANVFAEIPADISHFTEEIRSQMEITSNREFLCSLLTEINEQNWLLKDHFKEWKVTLEKEMHKKIAPGQSRHMLDLDRTANAAINLLEPYAKSSKKVFNLESEDKKEEGKEKKEKKEEISEHDEKALQFVLKEKALFRDATFSAQRLVESLKFTRDICAQLNEYYRHQSEEQQNNTLKTLTVITSTIVPMQLSTGVFGMNFEHMPELPYEYSYLIFWLLNVFGILLILGFWRSRGFI